MTKDELKHLIEQRRNEMQARLHELNEHLKEGWDKISEEGQAKLGEWLKRNKK
jgi:hypothetical protein